jgi:hypothetical protein
MPEHLCATAAAVLRLFIACFCDMAAALLLFIACFCDWLLPYCKIDSFGINV